MAKIKGYRKRKDENKQADRQTERLTWCWGLVWFMLRKCTGRKLGPYVTALKDKRVRSRVWRETVECWPCSHGECWYLRSRWVTAEMDVYLKKSWLLLTLRSLQFLPQLSSQISSNHQKPSTTILPRSETLLAKTPVPPYLDHAASRIIRRRNSFSSDTAHC